MLRFEQTANGREKRLQPILDFARDLHSSLGQLQISISSVNLESEINHHISVVTEFTQKSLSKVSPRIAKELEREGKDLWNLCIRLRRDGSLSDQIPRLVLRARVFSFHLLELGRSAGRGKRDTESETVYLTGLVLTLGRLCLDGEDLESARAIMQKAAEYIERLNNLPSAGDPDQSKARLQADYLIVRMALSWKENRLDVAEHMFSKAVQSIATLSVASIETMADTLRHIGADLYTKGDLLMAIKWFKRASDTLNSRPLDQLSVQGLDTRISICQNLVYSFLKSGSPEHLSEAQDLVSFIESEIGDKPIVLHWKLEILQQSPTEVMNIDNYAGILRRMIRAFDFSEGDFQFMLYHIKRLCAINSKLACGVLDDLLLNRALQFDNSTWLEKTLVTRVWASTMESAPLGDSCDTGLVEILSKVDKSMMEPLSPDAMGAAHALLWTKIEATMSSQQYQSADQWCLVALHPIFSNSGHANQAKFGRKQILCAIALNSPEKAYEIFGRMPIKSQDDCLTRFLMFKASLLDWNHKIGRESIEYLSRFATQENVQEMLYACIREAQQVGDKLCTLASLKAVAESWCPQQSSASSLPSILRCSVRLIKMIEDHDESDKSSGQDQVFSDDICRIFEIGAKHAKEGSLDQDGKKAFSLNELHWFRKNAFNIGVTNCSSWDLPNIIRIFTSCIGFISCYSEGIPAKDCEDLCLMSMRCHFVIAAAKVALARTEDQLGEKLQRYLELRRHVTDFDIDFCKKFTERDISITLDLHRKLSILLVFDFEAAVALKSWEDLGNIVRKADICKDETTLKAMGDCLLRSETPSKVMFATIRLIVNGIFDLEQFDAGRLAKYLRCIFQAILPIDETLALQLIDETLQIAKEGSQVKCPLPPIDLEWLVATTFNHAIDFYARGDEEHCHHWALRAIELAGVMDDGGRFRDLLQEKLAKLPFDSRHQIQKKVDSDRY